MGENLQKIPLKEYYDSLPVREVKAPKQDLVEDIARQCGVSASSVYRWLNEGVPMRFRAPVQEIITLHKKSHETCRV